MGARYAAFNLNTNTGSTTVPMWCLTGGTTKRVRLHHIIIGSAIAPANQAGNFALRRTSARGTATASFTPTILDLADPAAQATYDLTWSANPTITASSDLLNFAINQQATFQWMVDPDRGGIVIPGTAAAGLAMMSVSTTAAGVHVFNTFFQE
jgi:hypothetical protein